MTDVAPAELKNSAGPLKFLDYFTSKDEGRFEGRDDAIERVCVGVIQHRSFVLYGASGSGKTSLLLAGVFPELTRRGYRGVYVRLLTDPVLDLQTALRECADGADPAMSVPELMAWLSEEKPLVIAFDQFEEFFNRFEKKPKRQEAFLDLIATLFKDSSLDLKVVFSLRQEWLANLGDFHDAVPDLFSGEYRLQLLTSFGARQAIASQLEHAKVEYEPRLLVRLVDYLEASHFDPTILQLVIAELYRLAEERDPVTIRLLVEDLDRLGTVEALFQRYLEVFAKSLPENLQLAARAVLDAMTTGKDTKYAITVELLRETGYRVGPADLAAILTALEKARLVRVERRPDPDAITADGKHPLVDWYELIHERLVKLTKQWLLTDRVYREFQAARELLRNWMRLDTWRTNPELFPSRASLRETVLAFADHLELDPKQEEYILWGTIYRDPENVPSWSNRTGKGEETIGKALADTGPGMRAAAIRAAVPLKATRYGAEVVRLCLEDPDDTVRKAAGDAVGAIASEAEQRRLVSALSRPAQAERAREGLVRLAMRGAVPPNLWKLARWSIQREATKRLLEAAPRGMKPRVKAAATQGLAVAIAWAFVVGVPLALIVNWTSGQWFWAFGDNSTEFVGAFGTMLIFAVLLGVGYGALLGHSIRRIIIKSDRPQPFLVSLRAGWVAFAVIALAIFIVIAFTDEADLGTFLATVGLFGSLKLLISATAFLSHRVEIGPFRTWRVRFAVTGAVPIVVGSAIASLGVLGNEADSWPILAGFTGLLAALTASEWPQFPGVPASRPLPGAASLPTLLVLLTTAWLILLHGPDTLPLRLFADRVTLGEDSLTLTDRLAARIPDAAFHRVESPGEITLLAGKANTDMTARLGSSEAYLWKSYSSENPYDSIYFAIPKGDYWLSTGGTSQADSDPTIALSLRSILDQEPAFAEDWRYTSVRVTEDLSDSNAIVWKGHFAGRLTDSSGFNAIEFRVLPSNPLPPNEEGVRTGSLDVAQMVGGARTPLGGLSTTFVPGPRAITSAELRDPSSVFPLKIVIDESGRWSLELRFSYPARSAAGQPVPALKSSTVSMVVGYRPVEIEPHEYVEQVIEQASRVVGLGLEPLTEPARQTAGWLLTLASRYAREDSTVAPGRLCLFGALYGYESTVREMCDLAIRVGSPQRRMWAFRAVVRARSGDLSGAALDLHQYVAKARFFASDSDILQAEEWLAKLGKGINPFEDADLPSFRTWQRSGSSSDGKGSLMR